MPIAMHPSAIVKSCPLISCFFQLSIRTRTIIKRGSRETDGCRLKNDTIYGGQISSRSRIPGGPEYLQVDVGESPHVHTDITVLGTLNSLRSTFAQVTNVLSVGRGHGLHQPRDMAIWATEALRKPILLCPPSCPVSRSDLMSINERVPRSAEMGHNAEPGSSRHQRSTEGGPLFVLVCMYLPPLAAPIGHRNGKASK